MVLLFVSDKQFFIIMDCIPNQTLNENGTVKDDRKFATMNTALLSFVAIGLTLNFILMALLLADRRMLTKKFSWLMFFQSFFDCLALFVQSSRMWTNISNIILLYIYHYSFQVIFTISIWMLAVRSFIQARVIRKCNLPSKDYGEHKKLHAFVQTLKILSPLCIGSLFINLLLPMSFCQTMLEIHLTGYPPVGDQWPYFLLASNIIVGYIPITIMITCTSTTIIKICKPEPLYRHNSSARSIFHRRKQSSIFICTYIIISLIFSVPSQIYRFYLFFNQKSKVHNLLHHVLNYLSYCYIPLSPCLVFVLCVQIRRKFIFLFNWIVCKLF